MRHGSRCFFLVAAAGLAGCAKPPTGFDSPVPAARLHAITQAADERDTSAIPNLITLLGSDDPVVRMASIRTLELLTGQTLGYDYAAPEWERRGKVAAWLRWYGENHTGSAVPQGEPGNADTGVRTP